MTIPMYNSGMIDGLIQTFVTTGKFKAQEIELSSGMTEEWVQFRSNPQRFLPKIFEGDWAWPNRRPQPGPIRLVRILAGTDGVHRLIGRQGSAIFATPWIGM